MSSSSLVNPSSNTSGMKETQINDHENVLQKHVEFFDRNKDGIIYPWETFQGFRAIGSGLLLSTFASLFINMGLSRATNPVFVTLSTGWMENKSGGLKKFLMGKWPSPLFPIYVKNIKLAKHGSDSGVYDAEGRFVPSKFEEIFHKHALTNGSALTAEELSVMLKANREPKDYKGWIAALSEWKILLYLCKDKDGLLHKETVRAVYDGSLFEQMAKEKASRSKTA